VKGKGPEKSVSLHLGPRGLIKEGGDGRVRKNDAKREGGPKGTGGRRFGVGEILKE